MSLQKKFTLIPKTPGAEPPSVIRPMTSKQVRKAYKAANRMPPMSKAERFKQERAEQERIRKELEKEKAAAKVKVAKEKKREKELAVREQKRRNGLPLVSARPSQDTIARFVRGNGSGKKRDCAGQGVSEMKAPAPIQEEWEEEEEERGMSQHGQTNPATGIPLEHGKMLDNDTSELEMLQDLDMISVEDDTSPLCDETALVNDTKISYLTPQETVSGPQLPQQVDPLSGKEKCDQLWCDKAAPDDASRASSLKLKKDDTRSKMLQELDLIIEEDDFELELLALDAMATPKQPSKGSGESDAIQGDLRKSVRKATVIEADLGLDSRSPGVFVAKPGSTKPHGRKSPMRLMPPPPSPRRPRRRSTSPASPLAPQAQSPPLSTQAILLNLDDFFPTSSQQARELEEEAEVLASKPAEPDAAPGEQVQPPEPASSLPSSTSPSGSPSPSPKPFFTSSGTNEMLATARLRSRRTAEREEHQRMLLEAAELERMGKQAAARKAQEETLVQDRQEAEAEAKASGRISQQRPVETPVGQRQASSTAANKLSTPSESKKGHMPMGANSERAPTHANKKTLPTETTNKTAPPRQPYTPETPTKDANKENVVPPPAAGRGLDRPSDSQETEYGGDWVVEMAMELMI